jgi:hypothetical protein
MSSDASPDNFLHMKIAFCSDISQFHLDRLRDRSWSQRFLGSAWATSLYEREAELGIELVSGDIALQKVKSGEWLASEVHVVQEMDAHHGLELCRRGAIPSIIMMLESPLIAYRSVDRLMRSNVKFKHCIGPKPIFEGIPALQNAQHWRLSFPSFWLEEIPAPQPWVSRKNAVLVAANKYWRGKGWAHVRNTRDALRVLRHGLRKRFSQTYQSCWQLQLHDARIDLLHVLGLQNKIEVYGRSWDDISNLPANQAAKINDIQTALRGLCDDKHKLLSRYKFTIAYENTAYPGYITEKVIDAIVSASIPVYLGAPDIGEQLPIETFIDARTFTSPESLAEHMDNLTESEADAMLKAGRRFLQSPQSKRYSYEGFGEWVVALVRDEIPRI